MRRFLNSRCPFTVLEAEVTWGYFIDLSIKGFLGVLLFFFYYVLMIGAAEVLGVAG